MINRTSLLFKPLFNHNKLNLVGKSSVVSTTTFTFIHSSTTHNQYTLNQTGRNRLFSTNKNQSILILSCPLLSSKTTPSSFTSSSRLYSTTSNNSNNQNNNNNNQNNKQDIVIDNSNNNQNSDINMSDVNSNNKTLVDKYLYNTYDHFPRFSKRWWLEQSYIMAIFACTGSSALMVVKYLLKNLWHVEGTVFGGPWQYTVAYFITMFTCYPFVLLSYGTFFGRHQYFKKMFLRMTIGLPQRILSLINRKKNNIKKD